jgi:hypothetical protein
MTWVPSATRHSPPASSARLARASKQRRIQSSYLLIESIIPEAYALNQNYPNPFNPTTVLSIDLPDNSIVTLKVYNMLGQEVATLYDNVEVESGVEEVEFDASTLESGVYFYRVTAQAIDADGMVTGNTFTQTKKMMLVK